MDSISIRFRAKKIPDDVADLLDFWSGGVSSGLNLLQVINFSIDEVNPVMRSSVEGLARRVKLGVSWRDAFEQWKVINYCPEVALIGVIVEENEKIGTDLSTALKRVARIIRTNQRIKRELDALTVQSRLTCLILIGVPPVLLAIINFFTPEYLEPLWYTIQGNVALIIAFLLQVIGVIMVNKLSKNKGLL